MMNDVAGNKKEKKNLERAIPLEERAPGNRSSGRRKKSIRAGWTIDVNKKSSTSSAR